MDRLTPEIARQAEAAQLALEILWALARFADQRQDLDDDATFAVLSLGQCRKARQALRLMAKESAEIAAATADARRVANG